MKNELRSEFPQLEKFVRERPFVYLDSAATTLKNTAVIERISQYYLNEVSNIHRGAHYFASQGTESYERVRRLTAAFLGAASSEEIIFTRGTTEGINLVTQCFEHIDYLKAGDQIVLTTLEHHSNLVPWQILAQRKGLILKTIPLTEAGDLDLAAAKELIQAKETKLFAGVYLSNALGTLNPMATLLTWAKENQVVTLVDGAQIVAARPVNMEALGCDFFVFSGHKLFGPTGVGVLYAKTQWLETFGPYQSGGAMVDDVSWDRTTYLSGPQRFEAGTPNIAGVIGLGAAIEWILDVGFDLIESLEKNLTHRLFESLQEVPGVRMVGLPNERINIVSFLIENTHPSDVGSLLDQQGIAVRTGHHCCQPLMKSLNLTGTIRASISLYNDEHDIDLFVEGLKKAQRMLS